MHTNISRNVPKLPLLWSHFPVKNYPIFIEFVHVLPFTCTSTFILCHCFTSLLPSHWSFGWKLLGKETCRLERTNIEAIALSSTGSCKSVPSALTSSAPAEAQSEGVAPTTGSCCCCPSSNPPFLQAPNVFLLCPWGLPGTDGGGCGDWQSLCSKGEFDLHTQPQQPHRNQPKAFTLLENLLAGDWTWYFLH